jgi:hypothetical protein
MRRLLLALVYCVWAAGGAQAQSVSLAWDQADPSIDGTKILSGTAPGVYNTVTTVPGPATSAVITGLTMGRTYWHVAEAYRGLDVSPVSNEVSSVVQNVVDPSCVPPLGANAIQIFPTALVKTGSGGAGSRARLDFQIGSPGSPVTAVQVQANGVTLGNITGTSLGDLAGMWWTVPTPSGTYPLSITAMNLFGCVRTLLTTYVVTVP